MASSSFLLCPVDRKAMATSVAANGDTFHFVSLSAYRPALVNAQPMADGPNRQASQTTA